MIKIQAFTFNPSFYENTYVLFDETGECIIIDPGCHFSQEQEELESFIQSNKLKVVKLLNTHCHIDHVLGNAFVKRKYQVPLSIHKLDQELLLAVKTYADLYGFQGYEEAQVDDYIDEGDTMTFGNSELKILFVPGHAPGHIVFYNEAQKFVIGGDVLFQRSIGRTDLPGGDFDTLIRSIHEKMFSLADDYIVYPGHGEPTTIGEEKQFNPFCAVK